MTIGFYSPLILLVINLCLAFVLKPARPVVGFQAWNIVSGIFCFIAGLGNDFYISDLGMGGIEGIITTFAAMVCVGMFVSTAVGLFLHKADRRFVIIFLGLVLLFPLYFFFLHRFF